MKTPKEILIKDGHIVEFKDGNLANYFENSLGRFLCFGKCICANLDNYDENLVYNNRERDFCDIFKIYKVNSSHFFESNFESFRSSLNMQNKGYSNYKPVDIVFNRVLEGK